MIRGYFLGSKGKVVKGPFQLVLKKSQMRMFGRELAGLYVSFEGGTQALDLRDGKGGVLRGSENPSSLQAWGLKETIS